MTNTSVKNLEIQLVELINNSGVDIATVSLILDKLAKEANTVLNQVMLEEQQIQENNKKSSDEEQSVEHVEAEIVK